MAKNRKQNIPETDLYHPLRDYLTAQGYVVRGEVRNCDVAAVKGEDLILIEIKRSLSVALLAQAVERQKVTDSVYIAVPRPANMRKWTAQSGSARALVRRLELGLILVSVTRGKPPVEIVFHPVPSERRRQRSAHRSVLQEMERRTGDYNEGGSCRRKIVTAYRENAIHIACCLSELGPLSPRRLRSLGTGDKTLSILYNNVYSWFERIGYGLYALSAQGREEIGHYPELLERYLEAVRG